MSFSLEQGKATISRLLLLQTISFCDNHLSRISLLNSSSLSSLSLNVILSRLSVCNASYACEIYWRRRMRTCRAPRTNKGRKHSRTQKGIKLARKKNFAFDAATEGEGGGEPGQGLVSTIPSGQIVSVRYAATCCSLPLQVLPFR